jgi:hypothetical protein
MQTLPSGLRIIELIVLMAPAYVANMAPPFLRFWHGPNPPISRKWLGDHKTVGGFVVGIAEFFQGGIHKSATWGQSSLRALVMVRGFDGICRLGGR